MRHFILAGLLALAGLVGVIGQAQAEHHAVYYPYGWYVPKGPCWVQWHGYRELWVPPSATNWTVVNPLCGAGDGCRSATPQVLFQPIGYYPPPAHPDNIWTYGKTGGYRPVLRELIPSHPY
jgi:hypothetical protein